MPWIPPAWPLVSPRVVGHGRSKFDAKRYDSKIGSTPAALCARKISWCCGLDTARTQNMKANTMETLELHVCLVCLGRCNLLSLLSCWQKIFLLFPWFWWVAAPKGIALDSGVQTLPRRCKESTLAACAHWYFWPQNQWDLQSSMKSASFSDGTENPGSWHKQKQPWRIRKIFPPTSNYAIPWASLLHCFLSLQFYLQP